MRIIVNVDKHFGIGHEGKLQIYLRDDLKRFKRLTSGGVVVYGRKTLKTFPSGKPLPRRQNIVITSDASLGNADLVAVSSLTSLFQWLHLHVAPENQKNVWVIGGESIYTQLLPYCTEVWLTEHDANSDADAFFPDLRKLANWIMVEQSEYALSETDVQYRYSVWQNLRPQEM